MATGRSTQLTKQAGEYLVAAEPLPSTASSIILNMGGVSFPRPQPSLVFPLPATRKDTPPFSFLQSTTFDNSSFLSVLYLKMWTGKWVSAGLHQLKILHQRSLDWLL